MRMLTRFAFSMRSRLLSFCRETKGHAAVEFSFIAPVMVAMFFGSIEVTDGVMANKYISRATSSLVDLTSRARRIDGEVLIFKDDMTDIFIASSQIIESYGIEGATMRIIVIERTAEDDGYEVVWSKEYQQGTSAMTDPTQAPYTPGSNFTELRANKILDASDGLIDPGDHLVVAEIDYSFKSSLSNVMFEGLEFDLQEIRLPREGRTLHFCNAEDDCTNDT